jgi:hypothetical protein
MYRAYFAPHGMDPLGLNKCKLSSSWKHRKDWGGKPYIYVTKLLGLPKGLRPTLKWAGYGIQYYDILFYVSFEIRWNAYCKLECKCKCPISAHGYKEVWSGEVAGGVKVDDARVWIGGMILTAPIVTLPGLMTRVADIDRIIGKSLESSLDKIPGLNIAGLDLSDIHKAQQTGHVEVCKKKVAELSKAGKLKLKCP